MRLASATGEGADESGGEPEAESGERRQITVLFCDLVGSTDLSARLDPEDYREALRAYHSRADAVIARYGSYVAQHLGDGLLVYFGWPQTYDDAAERAVRAALELIETTATVEAGGAPLAARVGLHTGSVVVGEVGQGARHETLALGDTPNIASRVQSLAAPGQVLITAATHRLVAGLFVVEDRGAHPLKGVPQPTEVYRVVQPSGARGRLAAAAARGYTPFVNRKPERALLRNRFERVCDGEGQVVLLTGEAGIGKSRLVQVLREELADAPHAWLETAGAAHFANTPFYAVAELFRQRRQADAGSAGDRASAVADSLRRAGLDPVEALPLVAPLLDIVPPDGHPPMVVAPEVARRRLLATLVKWVFATARRQPLVILVEDLHWVDPSSLELLQLLIDQGATAPLLLLLTARPQFQAPWPLRAHYTQLTLNHLAKRHVRDMVLGVAAQANLLSEVVDAVAARTDGVPLFVEELTKAVMEVGTTAATKEIPSTLVDSLMARLDRLGPAAKEAAQIGSVFGRQFSFAMLQAVHPVAEPELEAVLRKLVDADLLHVRGLPPEATYTFKHALVQDAAYESLLRSRRRSLHRQVAATLRESFPALAAEHPELMAHHYEAGAQAELALAAWQSASELAVPRGALREAERYLERGLALLSALPEGRARDQTELHLLLAIGKARHVTKGYGAPETGAAFRRARDIAKRLADPAEILRVLMGTFAFTVMREGPAVARSLADELMHAAEQVGEPWGFAWAHLARGLTRFYMGDFAVAREAAEQAHALFVQAPAQLVPADPAILALGYAAYAAWHLGHADDARRLVQQAQERAAASERAPDRALGYQIASVFHGHMLGDLAATAVAVDGALAACAEEPSPAAEATAQLFRGWLVVEEGDTDGGLAIMVPAIERLATAGFRLGFLPMAYGLLADADVAAGRLDDARRALDEIDGMADAENFRANTLRRRAELLARDGAADDAVEAHYRDALACARQQGTRAFELRAALSYGRWLREHSRGADAAALLAPICAALRTGFDTRDLRDAVALLEALRLESQSTQGDPGGLETYRSAS